MGARRNKLVPADELKVVPRCGKYPYSTHSAANQARRKLYRVNRQNKTNRGELDVYYCSTCQAHHVGHTGLGVKR